MKDKELSQINKAIKLALFSTTAVAVSTPAVHAADEEKGEKIVVTGSRIKRVDIEGPSPITVIGRDQIDQSGDNSVADVLRSSVFNSFGSFRERSGSGNGATGNATVSLRGLGASRTLILIDGKRAPSSPSFGGGGAQNLNLIPVSAVERIEILRDGASAVYGSDALAGVINIILRKDFDGLVITAGAERPTEEGADGSSFSLSAGVTSGKGNITFVVDHVERKQLFNKDRDFTSVGLSVFGFPGSFYAYGIDPVTGARDTFEGTFADARCPTNLGDSEDFPNSLLRFGGVICGFNYSATSAHSAALSRDTVFISSNYELSDSLDFNARVMLTKTKSFGRYAPAPVTPLPTMAADNPNNPTNPVTGDPRFINGGGPYELDIFYRNVPGGTRDSNVTDTLTDILLGLQGSENWGGGTDWELNVHHSRSKNVDLGTGYGFNSLLQNAIDDGSYDLFNVNDNFSEEIAQSFGHETVFEAEVVNFSFDGNIVFDLFETDAGAAPLVLGFEYDDLNFFQLNDPQSNSGNVFGTSGGDNVAAGRTRKSLYAETVVPVTDQVELDIALRFDDYSDFGSTVNPKISASWRPTDELLVRASFGKGFRAPTMTQLFGNNSQSFNGAVDTLGAFNAGAACDGANPPRVCGTTQYQNFTGGNPNLNAETSESISAGVVYNPFDDFSIGLNYYAIDLEDGFQTTGLQAIFNNDFELRNSGGDPRVVRNGAGQVLFVNRNVSNTGVFELSGVDLDINWGGIDAGEFGEFSFQFELSQTLDFESIDALGATDVGVGQFRADNTASPEYRAQLNSNWSNGNWGASMQIQFIPSLDHFSGVEDANGDPVLGPDGTQLQEKDATLDSWTTVDVQLTYSTDWDGKIIIGARNLTNEEPPQNTTVFDSPFYASTVHDIFGRVPYIRYEQSF